MQEDNINEEIDNYREALEFALRDRDGIINKTVGVDHRPPRTYEEVVLVKGIKKLLASIF